MHSRGIHVRFLILILFSIIAISTVYSETLTYNDTNIPPQIIECQDNSTECVINCVSFGHYRNGVCEGREIHCHRVSELGCTINLMLPLAAAQSKIYTHQSETVHINNYGEYGAVASIIYAHERIGAKLYIFTDALEAFRDVTLYAPVGEGSLLSMKCFATQACALMEIFDDGTTEVYMQPNHGIREFEWSVVKNIFDDSSLNISRSDPNYIGMNVNYRGSVFLNACSNNSANSFDYFKYYGDNHGELKVLSTGLAALVNAQIYAKTADSVNIYCRAGGDCSRMKVECPENNQNNACKIFCDPSSYCHDMEVYTTNGYCEDAAVVCVGDYCKFAVVYETTVYCEYNQRTDYCFFKDDLRGSYDCIGWNCNNNYTEQACFDKINMSPVEISNYFVGTCDAIPTVAPTNRPTMTTLMPTNAPTAAPSQPSDAPTVYPTNSPITTYEPTNFPSVASTNVPAKSTDSPSRPVELNDDESGNGDSLQLGLIVGAICLILICVAVVIMYMASKKKQSKFDRDMVSKESEYQTEVTDDAPVSNTDNVEMLPNAQKQEKIEIEDEEEEEEEIETETSM